MTSRISEIVISEPPIGVNENLSVSINTPVKLVVRDFGVLKPNLVGYHKTWLCLSGYDEVAEISVVGLDIALTRAER